MLSRNISAHDNWSSDKLKTFTEGSQKNISPNETVPVEYIPRKTMCQLIYHELESVKGITAEQYEAAIQKYPVPGQLYTLLKEFYRIVFSRKSEELDILDGNGNGAEDR